jgi:transcription initiation factor IIE alpha subunit
LVCKNICDRIRYKRISFGVGGNYFDGKKYCRRCEVYLYHNGFFCPCCGMQLRLTPSSRECKEVLRKRRAIDKGGFEKIKSLKT